MTISSEQAHRPWSMFFGWLIVVALWMTGTASILSIGILILTLAAIATWIMLRQPKSRLGMPALVSIGGFPFLLLAHLNRNTHATFLSSTNGGRVTGFVRTNPWPWVTVGAMFFVASVVLFLVASRRDEASSRETH
jgi:hypothetical protein